MLAFKTYGKEKSSPTFALFMATGFFLLTIAIVAQYLCSTGAAGSSITYTKYYSEQNHFYIDYPSNWQVTAGSESAGVTTFTSKSVNKTDEGGFINPTVFHPATNPEYSYFSKLDVLSYKLDPGTSIRDFYNLHTANADTGNGKVTGINGLEAIRLDTDMTNDAQSSEDKWVYTNVFLVSGERGYIIAGFAEPGVLDRILSSFQAV